MLDKHSQKENIEKLRIMMLKEAEMRDGDLLDENVQQLSKELDKEILEWMKRSED